MTIASSLRLGLVAGAIIGMTPVAAAELVQRDLQVLLYATPNAYDFDLENGAQKSTDSDAFKAGTGLEVGGRWSFTRAGDSLGLIVGLAAQIEAKASSDTSLFATGIRPSAGLGWAINDSWSLVAEAGLTYGLSKLTTDASATSNGLTASGTYLGYDARLAALWRVSTRLHLEAHVGFLKSSHDLSDGAINVTLDQSGLYAGIGLVWRFSNSPPRLE